MRPTNARLAAALTEGLAFSRTMRGLVAALERVPLIVYLHDGPCGSLAESCLMMGATAGGYRFVHVNFRITDGRRNRYLDYFDRLVAQIGHELQHAVEVSRDPAIVDGVTLAAAYQRIGTGYRTGGTVMFETDEALLTGQTVLREWARRLDGPRVRNCIECRR